MVKAGEYPILYTTSHSENIQQIKRSFRIDRLRFTLQGHIRYEKIDYYFMLLCCLGASAFGEVSVRPAGVQMVWDDGGDHFGNFKTFNTKKSFISA